MNETQNKRREKVVTAQQARIIQGKWLASIQIVTVTY